MKLEDLSKEQLLEEIKKLKKRKKFGLVWENKPEKVVEKCKTELPVLEEIKEREIYKKSGLSFNLLIGGDNYHALSVLNYTNAQNIDFIYIDPPYNTGARDWKYNNDYVDSTDTFRHSKWISFMDHRLRICKNLLKEEGVICVTVDDYEMPKLWLLMESIFGEENHLGTVTIRNNPKGRMTQRKVSLVHEYALFFGKSSKSFIKKLPVKPEEKTHKYILDEDGSWYVSVNLRKQGVDSNATNKKGKLSDRYYPIYYSPKTGEVSVSEKLEIEILPIDMKGAKRIWRRGKDAIEEMFRNDELWITETSNGFQVYFKFRGGLKGESPKSIWYDAQFSASEHGTKTLDKILGAREKFQYPKSPFAVKQSILCGTDNKDAVILDFFAGSGTTGQAVLELNREDGGNRKFILCTNNENGIAEEVCYPRVKSVIEGYSDVEGIPANLKYFKTSFIPKSIVSDDTRTNIVNKSTEMICIKEGTFEELFVSEGFKIFKNGTHTTAILFNLDCLDELKEKIQSVKLPSSIYVFSLSNDTYDKDFEDLSVEHELCPIPESILEVYRKLFKD
jgi:adenine-specific DNA-methyltransferase